MACAVAHYEETDAQNSAISFVRYVLPGAAYNVSGNQVCYLNDGLERRCGSDEALYGKCHSWTTERVEVPPILRSVQIYSSKSYKSFNNKERNCNGYCCPHSYTDKSYKLKS